MQANWRRLKQDPAVVAAARATPFVLSGAHPPQPRLCPTHLLDPATPLLRTVFAGEGAKFPGREFASSPWLALLRDVGLRSHLEGGLLIECAGRVEEMGRGGGGGGEWGGVAECGDGGGGDFGEFRGSLREQLL